MLEVFYLGERNLCLGAIKVFLGLKLVAEYLKVSAFKANHAILEHSWLFCEAVCFSMTFVSQTPWNQLKQDSTEPLIWRKQDQGRSLFSVGPPRSRHPSTWTAFCDLWSWTRHLPTLTVFCDLWPVSPA